MSKTIRVHKHQDDFYLKLKDFKTYVDTTKVDSVQFTELETGAIQVVFFDKDNNKLPVKSSSRSKRDTRTTKKP